METVELTLHVGAGTFQPVRVDDLDRHVMHAEYLEVDEAVCERVAETRAAGGRVVAVGTTSVRSLETAAGQGGGVLRPFRGDSRLFIRPGYRFRVVDAMVTNFHLPESTLLMLVAAFAGHPQIMAAYAHAVAQALPLLQLRRCDVPDRRDVRRRTARPAVCGPVARGCHPWHWSGVLPE